MFALTDDKVNTSTTTTRGSMYMVQKAKLIQRLKEVYRPDHLWIFLFASELDVRLRCCLCTSNDQTKRLPEH